MKTLQWIILCGCLVLASTCFAYESLQGPTELLFHNNEKAYNGYTLFSSRGTWLIDMEGRVVHRWKIGTNPRLLDNGHLLDASKDDPSGFKGFKVVYPWGNDPDVARANWPRSGDPYETGPVPLTTPVGFYNGQLHSKETFDWPGQQQSYQTMDGSNGYGLYDTAGNVWEWCNDWYVNPFYESSPTDNPLGPSAGQPMPDGNPYRVLRSGSWYNGPQGHSRVSNRNPAHFRGPQDPDHPYYHIGFRVVRDYEGDGPRENPPLTPVPDQRNDRGPGRQRRNNTERGVVR